MNQRLLQMCDSAFPTGSYAFSDGLETYAQSALVCDAASLQALLETSLRLGWGRVDLPACALAWAAHDRHAALGELNDTLTALKVIAGPREASLKVGAALLRASSNIFALTPDALPREAHQAVAFGVLAHALNASLIDSLAAFTSSYLIGKTVAATRLFKLGGSDAARVVARLEDTSAQMIARATTARLEDIGGFTPMLDLCADRQRSLEQRLFQS